MSVGYADDEVPADDELGTGRPDLDQLMADALPEPSDNVAGVPLVAEPDVPQQGAVAADGPRTPVAAGSTPAPATADPNAFPQVPQFPELGPPPAPPAFTGDPQKDVALNAQWQRDLVSHHGELSKRQAALAQHAAAVGELRGRKEAEVAQVEANAKKAEIARAAAERKERQAEIDAAVRARQEAARDVEGFKWDRPHTGREIAAIILGQIGATLQNVGAVQSGHAPTAQNEAYKGIQARMDREYAAKKAKLAGAGDALLMARHGAKDTAEAHRAAMNDLDAEMAAKYKAIAREADEQLRKAGVPAEQVKGNVLVVGALEKAAAHEGDIHNREEGHRDQRAASAATLALARANLGERRAARDDARTDKKEAADLKHAEAEEARTLRDPNTGDPLGVAPTAKTVEKLGDQLSKLEAYQDAAEQLATHIEKHGRIVNPFSAEYKVRESLAGDVQALGRGVKGIQATDAGQKLEHMIVGGKGVGIERSADPGVLRHLAAQAREQTEKRLRATLKPLPGESVSRSPSVGGRGAHGEKPADAPSAKPAGGGADKVSLAMEALDDPQASAKDKKKAIEILDAAGKLPKGRTAKGR
jgi:hypothetical protein